MATFCVSGKRGPGRGDSKESSLKSGDRSGMRTHGLCTICNMSHVTTPLNQIFSKLLRKGFVKIKSLVRFKTCFDNDFGLLDYGFLGSILKISEPYN